MKRVLSIEDHTAFHLAVVRAVLAGGALALLIYYLPAWSWLSGLLGVLLFGAAMAPPPGLVRGAHLVLAAALAGACAHFERHAILSTAGPALALAAYLAGGLPRWQMGLTLLTCTLLYLGAGLLPQAVLAQEAIQDLPGQVGLLASGLAMGLVVGSTAIVRQLRVRREPIDAELRQLVPVSPPRAPAEIDEIGELVGKAVSTYKEVAESLSEVPQAQKAAEDLVKKIARFGKKWRDIEEQVRRTDRPGLEARLSELAQRHGATSDEQAKSEYERAQAALRSQLDYLREIDAGRERAVARLHNQVATLERLRLAALRHHSVDAARLGEELKAVVEELNRAGQDLDAAAEALAEAPV